SANAPRSNRPAARSAPRVPRLTPPAAESAARTDRVVQDMLVAPFVDSRVPFSLLSLRIRRNDPRRFRVPPVRTFHFRSIAHSEAAYDQIQADSFEAFEAHQYSARRRFSAVW